MKVSAQYAQEHLDDLLAAADNGEPVEIARVGKPAIRLIVSSPARVRRSLLNAARKQIRFADDWNSNETNEEIASFFNGADMHPATPTAE